MKNVILLLIVLFCGMALADSEKMKIEDFLFTVESDDGSRGSAFLMKDADGVWMVSNCHVVTGKKPIRFINMRKKDCVWQLPEELEVAEDRDAIRFRVTETDGLVLASDYSFDDEVSAFGNSGGFGVVTKNKGQIVGQGVAEIEVTCAIIEGNSGGPVINSTNEVVGIATFILKPRTVNDVLSEILNGVNRQTKPSEGTRYENIRRFAIPLKDAVWQKTSVSTFEAESALFKGRLEECNLSVVIVTMMCSRLRINETEAEYLVPSSTIRKYNREAAISNSNNKRFVSPEITIGHHRDIFEDLVKSASEWNSEFRESTVSNFKVKYFSHCLNVSATALEREISGVKDILEKKSE